MTQNDLTKGPILSRIARLSLPIMATGFIQMSYQLLDMFWLGQGSTEWVAAAGMSGYVLWIANSLALIARIGTEIGVGQYTGAKNEKMLGRWIASGLGMALLGSLVYVLLLLPGSTQVIAFFAIEDPEVNRLGLQYLRIVALGIPFSFLNSVFTGIFTGAGNSRTPFILNSIGLVTNIVLDPILIFLAGWGVAGAAVATVVAQGVITLLFLYRAWRDKFGVHNAFFRIRVSAVRKIAGWGLPAALQSIFFAMVSALLSRLVAEYGAGPFAAYGVGVQIESVGWLSMMGLSSGLPAFTSQNYAAGQYEKVPGGLRIGPLRGRGGEKHLTEPCQLILPEVVIALASFQPGQHLSGGTLEGLQDLSRTSNERRGSYDGAVGVAKFEYRNSSFSSDYEHPGLFSADEVM